MVAVDALDVGTANLNVNHATACENLWIYLISLTQAVIVEVVQLPLVVPVDPLHLGSLASSQPRMPVSDLYLPTNALM